MSYQIALAFEDGVTRFIKCDARQKISDASYKARINIPLDCRDGACGTCKVFIESGEFDGGDYIEDALTDEEVDQGYGLACQMEPESDMVIQIPTSSDVAKTAAATYPATVTSITRHSDSMVSFDIEIANRGDMIFLPGQYVNIAVPGGGGATRSYSFSSGPSDDKLSFLVKIVDGGLMSEYLRDRAQVGDTFEIAGPFGSFFLRDVKKSLLLLAGGSGLAPILSMLSKIKADGGTDQAIRVLYGVNVDEDLARLEDLEEYAKAFTNFSFDYVVGDQKSTHKHKGYVNTLIDDAAVHNGDCDVYLCGPPPMVEGVRQHFTTLTTGPASFYFEKFSGNVAAPVAAGESKAEPEKAAAQEAVAKQDQALASQPYEVGEVHRDSDARYDGRKALEMAAVSLTMGRLNEAQLAEFRILADQTAKHVEGEKILDREEFIRTNDLYHDFLFRQTGNPHLRAAYEALEVAEDMAALQTGGWISADIIKEHYELVDAFEANDLAKAMEIVTHHAEASKASMHRARDDA